MTSVIGLRRRRFWDENGFLIFPGFFEESEVAAVTDTYDRVWKELPSHVVVDDLVTGARTYIADVDDDESRRHNHKVNDLYLSEPELRNVAISERLGMILEELLGDEPTICNTLNFDKGSAQADHLDTLYMTPVSERGLVATWMALEDAEADAGPLRYYPESNQIAPYRFSSGSMHTKADEMPQWSDYMAGEVERRGLEEKRFLARKGDLFIWHALLLHGGSPINNPELTRQSLVTHYWPQRECEPPYGPWDLRPGPGGWWIHRPPLDVPTRERRSRRTEAVAEEIDFPGSITPKVGPSTDLRERMDALEGAVD